MPKLNRASEHALWARLARLEDELAAAREESTRMRTENNVLRFLLPPRLAQEFAQRMSALTPEEIQAALKK